ncbi:hypothetical protein ACFSKI_01575 [Pseudogracilibacillus auburnensis]|uniref:Uncharacterized protein n=1 Tax=Pseudogracilibacillus auburnensis TaxID=1494959 RepID=A0A2V3VGK8_9BACI|nr:hypothetical protein [Pseudogracilibacillus auburnensis]PXW80933.1 hypothetical protein DFR56_12442 [Pseudogracilibacillus auburnensis]
MQNIKDYVKMVVTSMHVNLTDEQTNNIVHKLLENENYNKMLIQLENMIKYEAK